MIWLLLAFVLGVIVGSAFGYLLAMLHIFSSALQ